jgi:hypothetical protein
MLPFGVTIPVTVPQRSEILEGLMNNSVLVFAKNFEGRGQIATVQFRVFSLTFFLVA